MDVNLNNQTKRGTPGVHRQLLDPNDKIRDIIVLIKERLDISMSTNRIGLYFIDDKNKKIYFSNKDKNLNSYNYNESYEIIIKDFGRQIDWRLVYIVEYLGPFFIFPTFYFLNLKNPPKLTQNIGLLMGLFHYIKRIYESLFIHKFSRDTMPLGNLFINIIYYWFLFGLSCGYSLFNDNYSENEILGQFNYIFVVFFLYFEYKNLKCHLIQKETKEILNGEHGILPSKDGFGLVSCANYFWEFLSWLCFSIFVNLLNFYIFTLVGFYIMRKWALEKHENYKNLFGDNYPKERKAFIPYLI